MSVHGVQLDRRSFCVAAGAVAGAAMTGVGTAAVQSFFQRRGLPIGLELYTVMPEVMADLDGALKAVAAIGYRSVEAPTFLGKSPAELRAAFDRAGLSCASVAIPSRGPGSLGDRPESLADDVRAIGAHTAVVLGHIPDRFGGPAEGEGHESYLRRITPSITVDDWKRTAELLNDMGKTVAPAGVRVAYHNHNFEFAPIGSTCGLEILIEHTDPASVTFEVDVGWVAAAGIAPVAFLRQHRGRIGLMHVKDIKPETRPNFHLGMEPAEIGSGALDWKKILPAAYDAGVRHFFVEQEPPFSRPRLEAAKISYEYLVGLAA